MVIFFIIIIDNQLFKLFFQNFIFSEKNERKSLNFRIHDFILCLSKYYYDKKLALDLRLAFCLTFYFNKILDYFCAVWMSRKATKAKTMFGNHAPNHTGMVCPRANTFVNFDKNTKMAPTPIPKAR